MANQRNAVAIPAALLGGGVPGFALGAIFCEHYDTLIGIWSQVERLF